MADTSPNRCPVCAVAGGAQAPCPRCGAPHHPDCWQWNGGCAIFGCADAPAGDPARTLVPAPEALPAPAAPDQLVVDTPLQHEAFCMNGPLPPGVRAVYIATFALVLALSPRWLLPFSALLAGLPIALTRVQWRFQPGPDRAVMTVTVAGLPVHTRTVPLGDASRLEVRLVHGRAELALVLMDGRALPVTYDLPPGKGPVRRLLAVVRGVQAHTHLTVTSRESRDPVTMTKRLERLRTLVGAGDAGARQARVSVATVTAMLAAVLLAAPAYSSAVGVIACVLAAGAVAGVVRGRDPAPLGGEGGRLLRAADVAAAEEALADLETAGPLQTGLAAAAPVAAAAVLAALGSQMGNIGLLFLAIGTALNAADCGRTVAVQKVVQDAQLADEEPPPALPARTAP